MLPVIIGSVIVIILLATLVIHIVRKKRAGVKYDLEQIGEKSEEFDKLNPLLSDKPDVIVTH